MAYNTKYRIAFKNELSQEVEILLKKKDGAIITQPQNYAADNITLSLNGEEGKMTSIIGGSLDIEFDIRPTDLDYWNDFINAEKDTWICICTIDGQLHFEGYVLPDEGQVPFQDKPYSAKITAVDGIGLLKDITLVQPDGTDLDGLYSLIKIIAYALQQTGLALPIRVEDDLYHASFIDRNTDISKDMFSQSFLEYRSLLKDATTFQDCYTVIQNILKDTHRLSYWNGVWVIKRISLFQYWPFAKYYTVYDYNGANPQGFELLEDDVAVGKDNLMYPHGEDQLKSVKKAAKSTKTIFNYDLWPEIPKNNKFERGTKVNVGIAYDQNDLDGDGNTTEVIGRFEDWTMDTWRYGTYSAFPSQNAALPALTPTPATAFIHKVFNDFDVELERYVVLNEVPAGIRGVLFAEGIPVISGDKITITFDYKTSTPGLGTQQIAFMYLQTTGGPKQFVESQNTSTMTPFYWVEDTGGRYISRFYDTGENRNRYTSINISPPPFPANGTFYIGILTPGSTGSQTYIKNFNVDYQPYVAGGYIQVKGEYRITSQDINYPDKSEEEVFISDNQHKIFKGALLDSAGVPLTPNWHRMGIAEKKPYTWFTNNGKFNQEYRRFWFVEGSFTGNQFAPVNDQENYQPLGLHKVYRLVDIPGDDRRFMITAPVSMDLVKGWASMKFHEVLANPTTHSVIETKLNFIQRLIDEINNTTEAEWESGTGSTPAPGTFAYKPIADKGGPFTSDKPDSFTVYINTADQMTATATNILGEAAPVITRTGNAVIGSPAARVHTFKIEGELKDGDIFIMHAYGFNVGLQVQYVDVPFQSDGLQIGQSEFKYIF